MAKTWIKTRGEIERLRESGKQLAQVTHELIQAVRPGITTGKLGALAEKKILDRGGIPIFKGYGRAWGAPPFPGAVCLSLNDEVVHGIPRDERIVKEGDLLKIDIGMRYNGMITDMARTVCVGQVMPLAEKLQKTTEASLRAGVAILHDGAKLSEYAGAVEGVVKAAGFLCVHDLVGHGVGEELHEEPQIPNYAGSKLPNFTFRAGMVVALEPMVNTGGWEVELAPDGWTFVTADGSLSAHWEDSVLITEKGAEVLTAL
ncbi:MAG: type I methionyl aminopeptidase [Candidatus Moraniibacteriota bacterium]